MTENKTSLIYQYLFFKGDLLAIEKKNAVDSIKRLKSVSVDDIDRVRNASVRLSIFEEFSSDICEILKC